MTETTRPLFRAEAIEAHARGRGADDEGLDLKERRTSWSFRILILLLVAVVSGTLMVNVDETARGEATVAGRNAVIALPVSSTPRLRPGLQVTLNGARGTVTAIQGTKTKGESAFVDVLATFDRDPVEGTASVRLSRGTLVSLLLGRRRA